MIANALLTNISSASNHLNIYYYYTPSNMIEMSARVSTFFCIINHSCSQIKKYLQDFFSKNSSKIEIHSKIYLFVLILSFQES